MAVYYTETMGKISQALWALLKFDLFDEITITQICQQAEVGRRSFYRHFASKQEVLQYDFQLRTRELAALISRCGSMEEMIGVSFRYFKKMREILRLVRRNDLWGYIFHQIQDGEIFGTALDSYMDSVHIPASLRPYVANVIASVHSSLLLTWVENDFAEDWRELTAFEISMFSAMMKLRFNSESGKFEMGKKTPPTPEGSR